MRSALFTSGLVVLATALSVVAEPENIARGKTYRFSRPSNYIYCTDAGDATQLTDGYYDTKPQQIWVRKETVGWSVGGPEALAITVDLGKVEPISGVSLNFAAGMAGVSFPKGIYVYTGEDGKTWRFLGDVLQKSTVENAPPKRDGYEVYRAWSDKMPGRGRYVMFLVSTTGYLFSDEIEVYRGDAKLLKGEAPGRVVADPFAHIGSFVVCDRVERDLKRLAPDDKVLAAEVAKLAGTAVISNTILPLCETHRKVWAKNAGNLRAAGYSEPVLWTADRWANLDAFAVPDKSLVTDEPLKVEMMRGEVRATAVNVLNPTDRRIVYEVSVEGLPAFAHVDCREVPFTDTPTFVPVAAALVPGRGTSIALPVEAGTSKQLWISFARPTSGSGVYEGRLVARAKGAKTLEKPIRLILHDFDFPKACELHLGGFDYQIGNCGFYHAPGNLASQQAFFRDNYIDMPWAPWGVAPQGAKADATGHIVNADVLSYRVWDEWIARFPEARIYAVFISAERFKGRTSRFGYAGFDLGSPEFNRYVGEYFAAWTKHMRAQGIDPSKVVVLIVDEPGDRREPTEYPKVIVAWAKAIKAAAPELKMMVDPDYEKDATIAGREMYEVCDIICPKLDYTADPGHEFNRDFFLNEIPREKLWFYQCNGPSRSLDPVSYYRQHFWSCWEYGAHAAAFWAFGCGGGIGDSWRAYAQTSAEYSPYFVGQTEVMPAKQSEGIREGMEDYEYLKMLKTAIDAAKAKGGDTALAEKVLAKAVRVALNQTGEKDRGAYSRADDRYWKTDKDRSAPDRARLAVLRMLTKLKGAAR